LTSVFYKGKISTNQIKQWQHVPEVPHDPKYRQICIFLYQVSSGETAENIGKKSASPVGLGFFIGLCID